MAKRHATWLDESGPAVQIQFSLVRDRADIFIDTTGAPLYKRGWRTEGGVAPIRENTCRVHGGPLALSRRHALLDPMCGSGTIAIEAALKARRRAPGLARQFDAQTFPFVDSAVWDAARGGAHRGDAVPGRDRGAGHRPRVRPARRQTHAARALPT